MDLFPFYNPLFDIDFISSRKKPTHKSVLMAYAIYDFSIEPVVCFPLLLYYCYYLKRGAY